MRNCYDKKMGVKNIVATDETVKDNEISVNRPRKPVIAFLFTLFLPGLGQLYNGQINKAFLFFVLSIFLQIIYCRVVGLSSFNHFLFYIGIAILFRIYILIDAVRIANKQKEFILKRYNSLFSYLLFGLFILTCAWYIDFTTWTGYRTFIIPSTGNNPTLHVDDRIVADMSAYDNKKPSYGDLVTFRRDDGEYYVYRVVGLPNDRIKLEQNNLLINGVECKSKLVKNFQSEEFQYLPSVNIEEWEEIFPNGHKHLVNKFTNRRDSSAANFSELAVPTRCYFLLGDNRDNAADSRFTGMVREDQIEGKVLYSYWGNTMNRINVDFKTK